VSFVSGEVSKMKKTGIVCLMLAMAASVWAEPTKTNTPVVVAVIDSGVLADHPSLEGRLLPGVDMVSGPWNQRGGRSTNPAPDERNAQCDGVPAQGPFRTHGTEVASVVAGNGKGGVVGVAPNAMVLPVRVMSACGMSRQDLVDALAWSAGLPVEGLPLNPYPAQVINLSLTGGLFHCGRDIQAMINQLVERNVFVVVAAGNTFHQRLREPANCKGVISVGAVDRNNQVANYSALDERTVVYAQGGTISRAATNPGDKIATFNLSAAGSEVARVENRRVGTSFAAPLVSGFIANQISLGTKQRVQVMAQLMEATETITAPDVCKACEPRRLRDTAIVR
jgi:serine protease